VSWNRIILTLLLSINVSTSILYAQKISISEDELIMRGILYNEYKSYENSYEVYKELFDTTQAEVYLFKEATASLLGDIHILDSIKRLKMWDDKYPNTLEVRRLLIPLYLTARQVENAKIEAEFLLESSNNALDLDLASNTFLYGGEFERALVLLSKIYETVPRESILIRMVEIMDELTGERKKAIQLLETHRRINIVSEEIYIRLLRLYQKEKDIDGILETYKDMYALDNKEEYLNNIIDAYSYKRDFSSAIVFLEKEKRKPKILYELYKIKQDFTKAIDLLDILYKKDNDAKWLAEKGILLFENAEDKDDKKMIKNVLYYLEKAIVLGKDDSLYLNYYGYTLIEKEVDIKKGMKFIKNALMQQPDNTYYLDSLAWGHYKSGECSEAYTLMKRVVEEEGLEEIEIIRHWDAIRKCQ